MGQWKSKRGHVSDEMADILDAAFEKIGELPANPMMSDLINAIEFVSDSCFAIPAGSPVIEDETTRILREAFCNLLALPSKPTGTDIADAIEFVSRGSLLVTCTGIENNMFFSVVLHEAADGLAILPVRNINDEHSFKTIPNRGQIHRI